LARAAARADAFPFVAPLPWKGAVLAPEGVYDGEITPFSRQKPVLRFYPTATENLFVAKSRSIPNMQDFLSEARFPVSCYQREGPQHVVEFLDHGGAMGGEVARVTLNEQQEVLAMRWIPISEYISKAQPSQAAVPGNVSSCVTSRASSTPCFLR